MYLNKLPYFKMLRFYWTNSSNPMSNHKSAKALQREYFTVLAIWSYHIPNSIWERKKVKSLRLLTCSRSTSSPSFMFLVWILRISSRPVASGIPMSTSLSNRPVPSKQIYDQLVHYCPCGRKVHLENYDHQERKQQTNMKCILFRKYNKSKITNFRVQCNSIMYKQTTKLDQHVQTFTKY